MNLAETIKAMGKPQELEESQKTMFGKAGRELQDYARKSGGGDKADFEKAGGFMYKIAMANIADKGKHMSDFSKFFKDLDTDVRDRIVMILKKNNIMEGLEEQTMEPNGNPEDNMPASPDEKRMAMKQADFIQYVGREIAEYLAANKEFPEWMQNKLSAFHQKAKDMHSTLGGRYDNMDEEVDMDALHKAIKKKLSDEGGAAGFAPLKDVAKKMGVDLTPEMLKGMDDIEQHKDGDYILDDDDDDEMDESVELDENVGAPQTAAHRRAQMTRNPNKSGGTGYDLYHKDFSSAMKHAYDYAKKKFGIEIDPQEIDDKVASGPRKPSSGKTNSYRLKGKDGKKAVQIQVSNLDNKRYELNMYKESVELDEAMRTLEFEGNAKNKNLQNLAKKHGVKLSQKGKMVIAKGDREAIDTMEIELDLVESVEINEAFESEFKTDRYGNTNSFLDAIMGVVSEKKELDPVNKKALKKDFDDRKDKDLDNDGDVDDSDEYLHKRRKAISKAMKSEDDAETAEKEQEKEISDKEDESKKKKVGKSEKQTKVDVNPSIEEEKGEEMTSAEMEKRDEIMKSLEKRKDEFVKKYGDRAKEVMARTAIKMAKKHA